jgi:hypothetical protein
MMRHDTRRALADYGFSRWTRGMLACPLLRTGLALERRFAAFVALLTALWAEQRWSEMDEVTQALRPFTRLGARALVCSDPAAFRRRGYGSIAYAEALTAAELIACARIGLNQCDNDTVHLWVLPLLRKSTERYLARTSAGHFLCEHLPHMPDPIGVVRAIERDIPPRAWDDYSNFQQVFAQQSWTLRGLLTHPRIISELDRFLTRQNRRAFWRAFTHISEDAQ